MLRSLYAKLSIVTLALLALMGFLYLALSTYSADRYFQEVQQKLNQELADHLVQEKILMVDGSVNRSELEDVFHMLMVINPSIEVYLLDEVGTILAFSAKPGTVVRERVALGPIEEFLEGAALPILADDPRALDRQKVFSAAAISATGQTEDSAPDGPQGYVYVVLGGENYDSAAEMVMGSHILRLSSTLAGVGVLLSILTAMGAFYFLTRPLRALATRMDQFRNTFSPAKGQRPDAAQASLPLREDADELASLQHSFELMSFVIRDQLDRLERGDRLRRELVANISHDLRTPLTTLHGYLETLAVRDSPETPLSETERRRYIEIALNHSNKLGKLVAELFELARLDAKDVRPNIESFSLGELVQDVTQDFRLKAKAKGIRLATRLEDQPYVKADIQLIERLLANLIENAIRFTSSGGEVNISLNRQGPQVRVDVRDNGCGINQKDLPYVFERAWSGSRTQESSQDAGAGLGLAIAKRIVDLHQSVISVSSSLGEGSCFSFALNSERADHQQPSA